MRTTVITHACDFCGATEVGGSEPPGSWARLPVPSTNHEVHEVDDAGGSISRFDACADCLRRAQGAFIALATNPHTYLHEELGYLRDALENKP